MATRKKTENVNNSANNETKVICPVCGSEFEIGDHEHGEKNVTVIGRDSGLGTVVLPVSRRGTLLQQAGVDTSKYFSIPSQDGGSDVLMRWEDGRPVPVFDDDPVIRMIRDGGTVPNRNLFRRWVMSQVFHGLAYKGFRGRDGFTEWMKRHGYKYQWEQLVEEFRVQAKLYGRDMENFTARNRWFNKELAVAMAEDYLRQLRKDAKGRPQHRCKGVPYVTVDRVNYFCSDIEKKLIQPLSAHIYWIHEAKTPEALYEAVRGFWRACPVKNWGYDQSSDWKDAYKGMGAYATMQNLLRFHGCEFPKNNTFYSRRLTGLQCLEQAATAYGHDGEGWRLFGLMKQMIDENHIDIVGKMKAWAKAKNPRRTE